MPVLNVFLFNALRRYFGADNVQVIAEGIAIDWQLDKQHRRSREKRRPSRVVLSSGEEYIVRCPFCRDHRPRLYINHRWGQLDVKTGTRNLWLAQCFNEQCLSEYENQKKLFDWIYVKGGGDEHAKIEPGAKTDTRELREMPPPGPTTTMDILLEQQPYHHAIEYLQSRLYDPVKLGKKFGVGYVWQSHYRWALNRIYIPIRHEGILVGWQCRYIGDSVQGRSFNEAGVPKYFTCPGMAKRLIAYGMETALRHPTIGFVEGVTDAWNIGPQAMAVLGKSLSPELARRIVRTMKSRFGEEAAAFVMLDPEWDDQAIKKKIHPMQKMAAMLNRLELPTVEVWLPKGSDPGSLDRRVVRDMAIAAGRTRGVPVTFARKPR